ncbi:MAG: hypothetical protein ACHQ0J_03075 [Candidatus Dormibacterales bacterium]
MGLSWPVFCTAERMAAALAAGVLVAGASACEPPLGLGLPSTRSLESGAASALNTSPSFELSGSYVSDGVPWKVDLQLVRPDRAHLTASQGSTQLEAIVIGNQAYFRSQDFLSVHLGAASSARNLVRAAGQAWWTGSVSDLPNLTDFTNGDRFRATFLGPVVDTRTDHVALDGIDAVELSGARADVYISEAPPHSPLRVHLAPHASVDGMVSGDISFSNFGHDFGISAPGDVIDFSNLSTLPPLYTVEFVDTSKCGAVCTVSAQVKNLGGRTGATGPSTVTFTMADSASSSVLGSCSTAVVPDIDYNSTAIVSCVIAGSAAQAINSATVTAVPYNPGRS